MVSMTRTQRRVALPLAGLILGLAIVLAGCGASTSTSTGAGSASGSGNASVTPPAGVTATAGPSTKPLPSSIPVPPGAQLQKEYTATVNGRQATVWQYAVQSSQLATPQNVQTYYQKAMPAKGWSAAPVPTVTVQEPNGSTAAAMAYQQGTQLATVATGYAQANSTSGPLQIIITYASQP